MMEAVWTIAAGFGGILIGVLILAIVLPLLDEWLTKRGK